MFIHATNLLVHRRLVDDIERYRDAVELIVLPPPCPIRVLADGLRPGGVIDRASTG